MYPFTFKFQNLLNYREHLEEDEKNKFSYLASLLYEEEEKLEKLNNNLQDSMLTLQMLVEPAQNRSIDFHQVSRIRNHIYCVEMKIREQERVVLNCEVQLEEQRINLMEATQEKKKIEKMKEKKLDEIYLENNIVEQKLIDDLISFRGASNLYS